MEYDDYTTEKNSRKTEYDKNTTEKNSRKTEYDNYTTEKNSRKTEYDNYTTAHNSSDMILEENTENREDHVFTPSNQKKAESSNPGNLSKRWAKKQPTKNELVESFVVLKDSTLIMSNNVAAMDKRLTTLETNVSELIAYINEKI